MEHLSFFLFLIEARIVRFFFEIYLQGKYVQETL